MFWHGGYTLAGGGVLDIDIRHYCEEYLEEETLHKVPPRMQVPSFFFGRKVTSSWAYDNKAFAFKNYRFFFLVGPSG